MNALQFRAVFVFFQLQNTPDLTLNPLLSNSLLQQHPVCSLDFIVHELKVKQDESLIAHVLKPTQKQDAETERFRGLWSDTLQLVLIKSPKKEGERKKKNNLV